jgi:outer membrane receptor protein involved in Fe transport
MSNTNVGNAASAVALGLSFLAAAGTAGAEESGPIEEILVTATKRSTSLHDVPFSVSALSDDYLDAIDAVSFTDFIQHVPGLNLSSPGRVGEKSINIRGITPLGNGDNDFATVGFYIDDAPISDAGFIPDFALFDVARVEVLRGPQGTLFGEGSLGGTVRVVTNRPDPATFAGKGEAALSSTHKGDLGYRYAGMLNMPLVDGQVAVRMVGGYVSNAGFIDNLTTGSEDVDAAETRYLRVALGYTPGENLDIQASVTYQVTDGGEASHDQSNTPDLTFTRALDGHYGDDTVLATLVAEYDFGWAPVTSATSWFDREFNREFDDPFTAAAVSGLFGFPVPGVTFVDGGPTRTVSQEFRMASPDDRRVSWLFGLFYRDREQQIHAPVTVPFVGDLLVFDLNQDITHEHRAFFGDVGLDITERLHLSGGFRVFEEEVEGDTELFTFGLPLLPTSTQNKEDDTVVRLSISFDLTDDAMLYASYAEGFRPGGLNARLLAPTIPVSYGSDSVRNYEIGAKTTWLGGRASATVAAYHIDWADVQLADFSGGAANFTTNAGEADIDGLEAELSASLSDTLRLGFNAAYSETEFKEDVTSAFTGVQLTSAGEPLPFAPELSYHVFADGRWPIAGSQLSAFGRIDYAWLDDRRTDLGLSGTTSAVDAYGTADFRAGVEGEKWSLTVFATNLTDERATLNVVDPVFEGAYRNRPRTIGIAIGSEF